MKKNFFTGILTGLFSALLLVVVLGAALLYSENTQYDLTDTTEAKEDNTTEEKVTENDTEEISVSSLDIANYQEIVKKLEAMDELIDQVYLEDVKGVDFADGIYKGFMASLGDPYSTYYTADEYKALQESSSGVYYGIGASVSQDAKTGIITIVKPFVTGPAYKAGIKPGDIIAKVDGEEVTGMDLSAVVSKMKGKTGTKVKIGIVREGENEVLEFTVTRKKIEVPTIEYQMLSGKIGYIIITEFDEITVTQFDAAVDELEKQKMKALIVDVRNNPGGRLDSVVSILDRILPPKLLVYTEDKYDRREEKFAEDKTKVTVPMAVLVNGNSASASEIFAGTLQDYKTATIVGTKSFGKGIVQTVIPYSDENGRPDGTAVKLTISKYYTPTGRNIHGTGIKPDVEIELDEAMQKEVIIPIEKDNQLQKAVSLLKKKIG
jgi:carboxyl-terminal processing protease